MITYTHQNRGTCSKAINLTIDDNGVLQEVEIVGGCDGNTTGIEKLVKGRPAKEVAELLRGTDCHARGTSCPDQLAKAIDEALAAN